MPVLPRAANGAAAAASTGTGAAELPLLTEWAYDFESNQLALDADGRTYMVSGNEALKIWLFWAVTTQRHRWRANSRDYGTEMERMMGLAVTEAIRSSELERTIREAVRICPYVKRIESVELAAAGDAVYVTVKVESVYGKGWVNLDAKIG